MMNTKASAGIEQATNVCVVAKPLEGGGVRLDRRAAARTGDLVIVTACAGAATSSARSVFRT